VTSRFVGVIVLVLLATAGSPAVAEETLESAQKIVDETITRAGGIPKQADALARLAWPAEDGDPNVMLLARKALMAYGEYAIPTLRRAVTSVRPDQQEEVVWALTRAFLRMESGRPSEYLIGLEEAAWFGSRGARLQAIPELGRHRYRPSLLTMVDAAYEDPELIPTVIEALGMMGDPRARFFLEKMMLEGPPEIRGQAAAALSRIGGTALFPLKLAIRSDDPDVRLVAIQALLPVATIDDISTLHEYVYNHPEDDPGILEAVRASALMLEEALARQAEADSASAQSEAE
jgi:HEAT repeat protein